MATVQRSQKGDSPAGVPEDGGVFKADRPQHSVRFLALAVKERRLRRLGMRRRSHDPQSDTKRLLLRDADAKAIESIGPNSLNGVCNLQA